MNHNKKAFSCYATTAPGSEEDAWLVSADSSRGFRLSPERTLMLFAAFKSRMAMVSGDKWRLSSGAKFYHRQSEKRVLVAELRGDTGRRFDTDQVPTVGGETGLRGYPISYQSGHSRVLLTLGHRVFTGWYPFRIFRIGAAAFSSMRDGRGAARPTRTSACCAMRASVFALAAPARPRAECCT